MNKTHPHAAEIVEAIRTHKTVGRWTCSVIDECYSDEMLVNEIGWTYTGKPRTVIGAVREAVYRHNLDVEMYNEITSL